MDCRSLSYGLFVVSLFCFDDWAHVLRRWVGTWEHDPSKRIDAMGALRRSKQGQLMEEKERETNERQVMKAGDTARADPIIQYGSVSE